MESSPFPVEIYYTVQRQSYFGLEAHAIDDPANSSTHPFSFSAEIIRDGERDVINAKVFYGNGF